MSEWTPFVLIQREIYGWSHDNFQTELAEFPNRKVRKNRANLRLATSEELESLKQRDDALGQLHAEGLIVYAVNREGKVVPLRTADLYFHIIF